MADKFKLAAVLEFANKAGPGIKAAEKDMGGLGKAAAAVGTALTVAGVVAAGKAAYELGVLGAQSLRTKHAFEMISGSAYDASENLDAMRRATRGAMSEQAMMATASQLLQMGLAGNAAELEQVTTMATRLGSAMGKEAGPAVEEFSLMLANQSIPRLDTFGISASKVRVRILELQAATPGLSREMAFMQATMEEGTAAMERLGEVVEDEMLANERLEASWADLKAMAGEMLAPAMADVATALTEVIEKTRTQKDELDLFIATYGKAAIETQVLKHGLWESAAAGEEFNQMMEVAAERAAGVAVAVESGRSQVDGWTSALFGVAEAGEAASDGMYGLETSAKTVAGSFGEMVFDDEQLWKMAMASGATTESLATLAQHLGLATEAEIQNTLESYRLTELFGQGALTAEQYAAGISALETATIQAAGGFEGLSNDATMAEKGLDAMRVAQEEAVTATRDMSSRYGASEADFAAAEDARLGAIESAREMRLAEEEAADATEKFGDAEEQAASKAEGLDDKVRGLTVYGLMPMSEAAVDAELKTLGLREEIERATEETKDFYTFATLINETLQDMAGTYEINLVYNFPGTTPPIPTDEDDVPGHQSGTMFHRGGWALVGERGPELVAIPRGSQVWPTSSPQTRAAVNNRYDYGGDTIYINDRLAAALYLESRRRDRMQRIENM